MMPAGPVFIWIDNFDAETLVEVTDSAVAGVAANLVVSPARHNIVVLKGRSRYGQDLTFAAKNLLDNGFSLEIFGLMALEKASELDMLNSSGV